MRIASLLSSATEILFGIGAGSEVVAISHECDYPPAAATLPRATRSIIDSSRPSLEIDAQVKRLIESGEALYEIDRELIRELQPDLIVTQAQCDVCAVRYQDVIDFVTAEPSLASTRVLSLHPQSLAEILDDVRRLGEATNRQANAKRFECSLRERQQRILEKTNAAASDDIARPRVAVIEWVEPLMTAGNWTPELVSIAGGQPLLSESGRHSGYVTWAEIIAAEPEVLIVAPCGFDLVRSTTEARRLADLPGYQKLPAVANNRAFVIDGNAYLNRSGPRIIDSLEILAHLIRPELFPPPTAELSAGRAWTRLHS